MANETTTTSVSTTVYGSVIAEELLRELRPYDVTRPLLRFGSPGASKVFDFTLLTKIAPTEIRSITEAADQSTLTQVATTRAQATAAQKGIIGFVTDLVKMVSVVDILSETAAILARTAVEQWETDAAALLSFTNTTGGATTGTAARLLAAVSALEQRDVAGSLVAEGHPKQIGDLRADIVTTLAPYVANNGDMVIANQTQGYVGTLFTIPIFQTTVVPSSGGSFQGSVFRPKEAVGMYELWAFRTELQRDASKVGNEVVVTSAYGGVKISDGRGQQWLSTT